jgi:hypothetical protein
MSEPLPPDVFATLLEQAGLKLPPAEAEDLRHAHAKLRTMLAMLRDPAPELTEEPGFSFRAEERP